MNKTILIFTQYYIPGYKAGGPIRSISNLIKSSNNRFFFKVITRNKDLGDIKPYSNIISESWNKLNNANVYYVSPKSPSFSYFYKLMANTSFDIIYLNSFLNPFFTIKPMLLNLIFFHKPLILCPRGQFSPGAINIKKHKKLLYIKMFKLLNFHKFLTWQATTEDELLLIKNHFGQKINAKIAHNLSFPIFASRNFPLKTSPIKVVFLSRISAKKNLIGALKTLININKPLIFDIYGPASRSEDVAYKNKCKNIANTLPNNIFIRFLGEIPNQSVIDTLSSYDLFFLPTFGENFGHAILEGMAAGLPLLISDKTPWTDLEQKGIGWNLPPNSYNSFAKVIETVFEMTTKLHFNMRNNVLSFAKDWVNNQSGLKEMYSLFNNI